MATSGPATNDGRTWPETAWFAAVAFALFVLLRQQALHGTDWRWLVLWLDEPGAVHPQHPGYLPLARALRWLLAPLGLEVHAVLCVFSALGGALAVAGLHRAALAVCCDRAAARCAAALAMFTPTLFHFATVCELHAPFAAVMAWAAWAAVRWAQSGRLADAAVAGVLSGAATLMHATGHLIVPGTLAAVWWARAGARPWRPLLGGSAAFVLAHAAVWAALFAALRATGHLPASVAGFAEHPDDLGAPDNPLAYLVRWFRDMDIAAQLGPTVLTEWLQPYLPASLLGFAALRVPRLRGAVVLLAAALALWLVVTVALVHARTDERGAYLLPLLLPALLLMLEAVPRRGWPLLVALTIVCGVRFRGEPGRLPPDLAFGRAAASMAREQPTTFFVAAFPEMDGAFVTDAKLELLVALAKYDELRATGRSAPTHDEVVGWLQLLLLEQRQKGARLVVTDRALQWLNERVPAFAAGWATFAHRAGAERLPATSGIAGVVVR